MVDIQFTQKVTLTNEEFISLANGIASKFE